jgi:LAO/AO transport system ATPase
LKTNSESNRSELEESSVDSKENKLFQELILGSKNLEKFSLAKAISLLEREDSPAKRAKLFPMLSEMGLSESKGYTIGITGTPGAGKSSLISEICKHFLAVDPTRSLAIVAIDPSSNISGGSILGDRTRVILPRRENRIYFRSQASQLELGGVNPYTYHVIRYLRHFFDFVLVETVGIGQNEIEVSLLTDYSFLVMQPLGGDQVQFMKSGIMEVPDAFIINKCDEIELANSSYHLLLSTLEFLKDILPNQKLPPVFKTSVVKKFGINEVWDFVVKKPQKKDHQKEVIYQLEKWVRNEYGRYGVRIFKSMLEEERYSNLTYENLESKFLERIAK